MANTTTTPTVAQAPTTKAAKAQRPKKVEGGKIVKKTARQPMREHFASDREYMRAWELWRQIRNGNNEAVRALPCVWLSSVIVAMQ